MGEGFRLGSENSGILSYRPEGGRGKRTFQREGTTEQKPADEDSGGCLATRLAGEGFPQRAGQVVAVRIGGALSMGPRYLDCICGHQKAAVLVWVLWPVGQVGWEDGRWRGGRPGGGVSGRLHWARAVV